MKESTCEDCGMNHDPFGGGGDGCPSFLATRQDDYMSIAGEMYFPGESGYMTPDEVVDMMEPSIVKAAKAWALRHGKPWPPEPVNDLGMVTIISWGEE